MKQAQSTPRLRPPRWPVGLVPWQRAVEMFLEKVARVSGVQIEISGASRSQGGGGDTLTFGVDGAGAGGSSFCWVPTAIDSTHISLTQGSISDGVTERLPDVSSVTVHATDLNYVYLHCEITPSIEDSIVVGGTIDAVDIVATTTPQTNDNTDTYVLLCTWQAGALVAQAKFYSFMSELNNSGGNVLFHTWAAG